MQKHHLAISDGNVIVRPFMWLWDSLCPPFGFHQPGGTHRWGHCSIASVGTSALYLSFTLIHISWLSSFLDVDETPNTKNKPQRKSHLHTLETEACCCSVWLRRCEASACGIFISWTETMVHLSGTGSVKMSFLLSSTHSKVRKLPTLGRSVKRE